MEKPTVAPKQRARVAGVARATGRRARGQQRGPYAKDATILLRQKGFQFRERRVEPKARDLFNLLRGPKPDDRG